MVADESARSPLPRRAAVGTIEKIGKVAAGGNLRIPMNSDEPPRRPLGVRRC
jgi:hypothetical protein